MRRLLKYAFLTVLGSSAFIGIVYAYLFHSKFTVGDPTYRSFSDFDFASYSFGLVAVALTFAGIYISVIAEPCCDRLVKLLQVHFTPAPFQDMITMEKACNPIPAIPGVARTSGPQCAHAIISLQRWSALTEDSKAELLGPNGLGVSRSWFGPVFAFFQSDYDRLIVAAVGISTTLIYVALPIIYLLGDGLVAASMFVAIYVISVLEIIICALLYFVRWFFISGVAKEMPRWRPEMQNLLVMATMGRAQAVNP